MSIVLQLLAGFVLGAGFIAIGRFSGPRRESRVRAVGLVVAASIYVGFAAARREAAA